MGFEIGQKNSVASPYIYNQADWEELVSNNKPCDKVEQCRDMNCQDIFHNYRYIPWLAYGFQRNIQRIPYFENLEYTLGPVQIDAIKDGSLNAPESASEQESVSQDIEDIIRHNIREHTKTCRVDILIVLEAIRMHSIFKEAVLQNL